MLLDHHVPSISTEKFKLKTVKLKGTLIFLLHSFQPCLFDSVRREHFRDSGGLRQNGSSTNCWLADSFQWRPCPSLWLEVRLRRAKALSYSRRLGLSLCVVISSTDLNDFFFFFPSTAYNFLSVALHVKYFTFFFLFIFSLFLSFKYGSSKK